MSETRRAVYFDAPNQVSVRREEFAVQAPDVRVTSHLIAISHGTEMLFYRGPFPTGQLLEAQSTIGTGADYPIKYGYMNLGRTDAGRRVFAFAPHEDRFAASPDTLLHPPDDIDDRDAVLYPSLETAVQIVHDSRPALDERVLVCGLGSIGVLVALLLERTGAVVVATDSAAARVARARELGISALAASEAGVEAVVQEAGGRPDLAVNTSGSGEALQLAVDALRMEGTVVEASWYGEKRATLSLGAAFHRRRLTIRASQVSHINPAMRPGWDRARRTASVWKLMRSVRPSRLISHEFPLDDAAEAFRLIGSGDPAVMQVVLIP